MITDNMETITNLSLLSFAGLAFVVLLVSLELMKDETRRKVLEVLRSERLEKKGCTERKAGL